MQTVYEMKEQLKHPKGNLFKMQKEYVLLLNNMHSYLDKN